MNLDTIILNNEHQIRYEYNGNSVILVNGNIYTGDITKIRADVNKYKEVDDKPLYTPDGNLKRLNNGTLFKTRDGEPLRDNKGNIRRNQYGRALREPGTPVLITDSNVRVDSDGNIAYVYDTNVIPEYEHRPFENVRGLVLDDNGSNLRYDDGSVIYSKKKIYEPTIVEIHEPGNIQSVTLYPIHAKVKYTQNKTARTTINLDRYNVIYEVIENNTDIRVVKLNSEDIVHPRVWYYVSLVEAPFVDFVMQYSRMDVVLFHIPDTVKNMHRILNHSKAAVNPNITFIDCTETNDLFSDCINRTLPAVQTNNSKNFTQMFNNCVELVEAPNGLNTNKGIRFFGMFKNNEKLEEIPALDTENGDNFEYLAYNCKKLKKILKIDTRNPHAKKDNMISKTPELTHPTPAEQYALSNTDGALYIYNGN